MLLDALQVMVPKETWAQGRAPQGAAASIRCLAPPLWVCLPQTQDVWGCCFFFREIHQCEGGECHQFRRAGPGCFEPCSETSMLLFAPRLNTAVLYRAAKAPASKNFPSERAAPEQWSAATPASPAAGQGSECWPGALSVH